MSSYVSLGNVLTEEYVVGYPSLGFVFEEAEAYFLITSTLGGSIVEINKKGGSIVEINKKDGSITESSKKDGSIIELNEKDGGINESNKKDGSIV